MAVISSITNRGNINLHPTTVTGKYGFVRGKNGSASYFHLETYKQNDPNVLEGAKQQIQIDEELAKKIVRILDAEFNWNLPKLP